MKPKFNLGDEVVCRVGGPKLFVNAVSPFNVQINQDEELQSFSYTCIWFDNATNLFKMWSFTEKLLEHIKEEIDE